MPPQDLKHRVTTCLTKLSDRDTLTLASTELESIALTLTDDTFAPFLNYLSNTTSSDKSPVRKHSVRIIGFLSVTHGNNISPHVSKMLAAVVRRLRDGDSAVRSACIAAVTSISSEITNIPFSSLSKPLVDAVMTENEYNAQIGSALCLSAAVDASPKPEKEYLKKLLVKVMKLVKADGFKAKPALLTVIGSIVGAGGPGLNRGLLGSVVNCLVEFLSCEDWATRKAAVEALGRLASTEKGNLMGVRSSGLASLENKRFDKVKVVRESMNQTLELWKEIPDEAVPVSPQLNGSSPSSKEPATILEAVSSSKPSATATQSRSPPKSNYKHQSSSVARKMDFDQKTDTKVSIPVPEPEPESDTVDIDKSIILETEKRVISNRTRFGSRVVPFNDCEFDRDTNEHVYGNQKEVEDLSRIQKQLVQIENQQSNLLNLLQKFIGSSRSGMNSLETRVNGLEKTLDEISYDFAISTGRVSRPDSCCMSTDFLSPKYWRRAEGSFPSIRSPFRGSNQSPNDTCLPRRSIETLSSDRKKKPNS